MITTANGSARSFPPACCSGPRRSRLLADEAGMPESEAPPEETQQEDAALSDRDFYLEDSEVSAYAAANQLAGISKVHFYSLKSSRNHHDLRHIGRAARKSNGHKFRLLSGVLLG